MRTLGLEFCDEGFTAVEATDTAFRVVDLEASSEESPGFVYFDGTRYICGRQAQKRSRIYPRFVTDRCWEQLSLRLSDLNVPGRAPPRYSELAYRHLRMVWERLQAGGPVGKVVFALPGNYLSSENGDEEKIGLILGIAQDLNMPLAGIVDMACVSLAAEMERLGIEGQTAFHIDVHQRATFFSILELRPKIRRLRLAIAPIGFHHVFAELNPKLANSFLSQTAFDVTHDANTEQQFYNQTQNLLELFREQEEATIEMESLKRSRKMSVYRDTVAKHLEPVNESLAQLVDKSLKEVYSAGNEKSIPFVISERAAKIPGLAEKIAAAHNASIIVSEFGSAASGAALLGKASTVFENLEEAGITTSIDLRELGLDKVPTKEKMSESIDEVPSPIELARESEPAKTLPTHIVYKGLGARIEKDGFNLTETGGEGAIGISVKRLGDGRLQLENQTEGIVLVNGQAASNGVILNCGDVLTLGQGSSRLEWLIVHCPD